MLRAVASLHALRAFVMRALDKNSQVRVNYSGALLSILRAVAFCSHVYVKFKLSGAVFVCACLFVSIFLSENGFTVAITLMSNG